MAKPAAREAGCDIFDLGSARLARFELGPYATNCYVLWNGTDGADCAIVDASFGPAPIRSFIERHRLRPEALYLTHAHVDHIAGVKELRTAFPLLPIAIHQLEEAWLTDPLLNLSGFSGQPVTSPAATRLLNNGDTISCAGHDWKVLHTPGHSPGSVSLYSKTLDAAIVGDALFAGSVGRTDFPGCSFETLERSIKTKLYTLAPNTTIFPGHGPESTIGTERRSNPFVSGD